MPIPLPENPVQLHRPDIETVKIKGLAKKYFS